ncbi:hypothetical protein ACDZ29_25880 [Peribacillus sp. RS7]|jgi:hypothetical protein
MVNLLLMKKYVLDSFVMTSVFLNGSEPIPFKAPKFRASVTLLKSKVPVKSSFASPDSPMIFPHGSIIKEYY